MSEIPEVVTEAPRTKRPRRSAEDRIAHLKEQIERAKEQEFNEKVRTCLKDGNVTDPERAKELSADIKGVKAASKVAEILGLDPDHVTNVLDGLRDELVSLCKLD